MSGFVCPFCNHTMVLNTSTYDPRNIAFNTISGGDHIVDSKYTVKISLFRCPNCTKVTTYAEYTGGDMPNKIVPIFPISTAKQFPDYVPASIRTDYEEACSIVTLSPKASATLSRRCLQSMIRDFWQITGKKRLVDEIDALETKVPATQWKVLNSLRRIGNIGAHPEADVNLIIDIEPDDARKLIQVIELLIRQWYIERHEQEKLFSDILSLDQETSSQKAKE